VAALPATMPAATIRADGSGSRIKTGSVTSAPVTLLLFLAMEAGQRMATDPSEDGSSPDWGTLILEIQTDPAGPDQCPALGQIFKELFPFLRVLAAKWRRKYRLSEDTPDDLASAGWDKVSDEIGKFTIPEDGPEGIGRAFKGWVTTCCRRHWEHLAKANPVFAVDPLELSERISAAPSVEEVLDAGRQTHGNLESVDRSSRERQLRQDILRQELEKLPAAMRDALLETEDEKSVVNPSARGKTGDAARIAAKHGYTANAVRTRRTRLCDRVKARFDSEVAND